jgi:transposase
MAGRYLGVPSSGPIMRITSLDTKLLIFQITQAPAKNKKESEARDMAKATVFDSINCPSCGLDVHKDMIEACVIDKEGVKHRKTFDTMRKSLYALRDWILSLECLHVLMESTSVYWIPIYEILEEVKGMDVGVGNARSMKQVPGRPVTDKEDADWIARLCMIGFILKSFIVDRKFRELREYTRYHKKIVQERARQVNRIEKLLQMNGFKLSSVLSDITGASGMRLLKILRDKGSVTLLEVQGALHKRVKKTPEEIESAINGQMKLTSRLLLGKMLSRLETCDKEIGEIYSMMLESSQDYRRYINQIDSIPGLAELSAIYIIAEISINMSSFKTASHIAAWAGLAPKDNQSAGKLKSSKTKKANIYIKSILIECAWAAVRTRNTRVSNWYWSNVGRLGEKKAVTAVARKLLVYIYSMLKSGELYDDSLDVADTESRKAMKLDSARKIVEHRPNTTKMLKHRDNTRQDASVPTASVSQSEVDICTPMSSAGEPSAPRKRGRPRKVIDVDKQTESQMA